MKPVLRRRFFLTLLGALMVDRLRLKNPESWGVFDKSRDRASQKRGPAIRYNTVLPERMTKSGYDLFKQSFISVQTWEATMKDPEWQKQIETVEYFYDGKCSMTSITFCSNEDRIKWEKQIESKIFFDFSLMERSGVRLEKQVGTAKV